MHKLTVLQYNQDSLHANNFIKIVPMLARDKRVQIMVHLLHPHLLDQHQTRCEVHKNPITFSGRALELRVYQHRYYTVALKVASREHSLTKVPFAKVPVANVPSRRFPSRTGRLRRFPS